MYTNLIISLCYSASLISLVFLPVRCFLYGKGKGPSRAIKAHRAQHGQSMSGFYSLGT